MKLARLRVVQSAYNPEQSSLRGPKGRGQNDAAQDHITAAGFVPGEEVVVLTAEDFARLEYLAQAYQTGIVE